MTIPPILFRYSALLLLLALCSGATGCATVRRHPAIFALAAGAAVGATIAILQRGSPCPGEYASGDPPCYPPPPDFDDHHRRARH